METPIISQKLAKKSLSAKKPKKETIKNVLTKPFKNYWPLLTPVDNGYVSSTLEKLLPKLQIDKLTVPYRKIKKIPKNERKKFRLAYRNQPPLVINDQERQGIVFGVNDVSALLDNQQAACVLVASDVQPRLFVQHIIDKSVLYSVPVLVVTDLRVVLKNKCGISGAVVAIKNTVTPDSSLGLIMQTISCVFNKYPVPEGHINNHRRMIKPDPIAVDSESNQSVICISDSDEDQVCSYHLIRSGGNERVFVPEATEENQSESFISFDSVAPATSHSNNGNAYRPLVVARLKGDKNRNKRKLERFKKSRK